MPTQYPQYSHKQNLPKYDHQSLLKELFRKAKEKDEFEFCSTLLRLRGLEGKGWDTLVESQTLLTQTLAFVESPIATDFRIRLLFLTYCHAIEMFDFYSIIGNMLRVSLGERYSMNCFIGELHSSGIEAKYSQEKAYRIKEWAVTAELTNIGDLVLDLLVKEVRNAFFHSSYVLTPESFNIKRGRGVKIGNLIDPKVKLEWLMPRIELALNTVLYLTVLLRESGREYNQNKIVTGRIQGSEPVQVELLTQEGFGLIGFQSPPGNFGDPGTRD